MIRAPNTLRIIGGQWRGRKLTFPAIDAIRPTPDRVRETIFNWLQHDVVGARCLDLFAGSGALGLEALSRGAKHATFVDAESQVVRHLRETLVRLDAENGDVVQYDALKWIQVGVRQTAIPAFDLVFLDPPFAAGLLTKVCSLLERENILADSALIYMESSSVDGSPQMPANWSLIKSKSAGQVGYHLARRQRRSSE